MHVVIKRQVLLLEICMLVNVIKSVIRNPIITYTDNCALTAILLSMMMCMIIMSTGGRISGVIEIKCVATSMSAKRLLAAVDVNRQMNNAVGVMMELDEAVGTNALRPQIGTVVRGVHLQHLGGVVGLSLLPLMMTILMKML